MDYLVFSSCLNEISSLHPYWSAQNIHLSLCFSSALSQRSDPSSTTSFKCHWSFLGDSAPLVMVHILKIKPVKATLAFTFLLNSSLKGTFSQIIALCVSAHFTSRSCTHDGGKQKGCTFCISPGLGDAQFSKGADELCQSWGENKNKLPCLVPERRRDEFLVARGKVVQDQRELVECVQEGIRECKGQNLELARWQQSLTHWQGSQETILAERGWERKEDRKGLIIQSWLTVA